MSDGEWDRDDFDIASRGLVVVGVRWGAMGSNGGYRCLGPQ